jgi:fatty-acyl-CoA synthase
VATETTPLGTVSHVPVELADAGHASTYEQRAKQGRPSPFVEIRARNEIGAGAGTAGRWASSRSASRGWRPATTTATTAGSFHRRRLARRATSSIDARDRQPAGSREDLIKSGGEWISPSLESALMGHPAVAEAAVVAVASRNGESGRWPPSCSGRAHRPIRRTARLSRPKFPKFWLP